MIAPILKIHGTSSKITFDCENEQISASGEFFAKDGQIAGFAVSMPSLRHETGKMLTETECRELISRYEEYIRMPNPMNEWELRFE